MSQHFDVLITGAGVSGIGMACHLTRNSPGKTYAILERRQDVGGTWDLFKYPGIRSDSDMYTFGYNFRPWTGAKVLADGASIKEYVRDTAKEYGVDQHIRYGLKVVCSNWSSAEKLWKVDVMNEATGESEQYTANFVIGCTGYYNHDAGYKPDFPGEKDFSGQIIHPQHWPEDLDYAGKKVIVIGSGATAVTLVPAMSDKAKHVTMLQRSPTYMVPVPSIDPITKVMNKVLPSMLAYRITRTRNITINRTLYETSKKRPNVVRRLLLSLVRQQLDGASDMRHFKPNYKPWDQRLCAVSDGDLFKALKAGKALMVTDHIDKFTKKGILLKSGEELEADIIISATGLDLQILGGMDLQIDGKDVAINEAMIYRNVLLEGVPNAAMIFGYTNLSWTMKADIVSEFLCRLINHMDKKSYREAVAQDFGNNRTDETFMQALDSGYIRRAADKLPRRGKNEPWLAKQDYMRDMQDLRYGPIEDGVLSFDGETRKVPMLPGVKLVGRLRTAVMGT